MLILKLNNYGYTCFDKEDRTVVGREKESMSLCRADALDY